MDTTGAMDSFDDLLKDPDGVGKVRAMLLNEKTTKNTISLIEFEHYSPLFRYSGKDEIPEAEYLQLHMDYVERICRFDPVYVIGDDGKVAFVLPPVFNRTNPVNVLGTAGEHEAQAFINACNLPDEVGNRKRAYYAQSYKQVYELAQDHAAHEKNKEFAKVLSDKVLNTQQQLVEPPKPQQVDTAEIQEIENYDLKGNNTITSSTGVQNNEVLPYAGDEEIEYM